MPKQLYIPLPCADARRSMIERQIGPGSGVPSALSDADLSKIVDKTKGYSGMLQRAYERSACHLETTVELLRVAKLMNAWMAPCPHSAPGSAIGGTPAVCLAMHCHRLSQLHAAGCRL